jgi:hypothetical protein
VVIAVIEIKMDRTTATDVRLGRMGGDTYPTPTHGVPLPERSRTAITAGFPHSNEDPDRRVMRFDVVD